MTFTHRFLTLLLERKDGNFKLYIYSNPQTKEQAEHNLNTLQTANEVLQEKQTLLEQGKYEFTPEQPVKVSFKEVERKNSDKDFLIDLLQQVRNIEKQILEQLKY